MTEYTINIGSLRKTGETGNRNVPCIRVDRANLILGNPFILHNQHDIQERTLVISQYHRWSDEQINSNPLYLAEIKRIAGILKNSKEITLLCWCAPRPCHASKIKELILQEIHNG